MELPKRLDADWCKWITGEFRPGEENVIVIKVHDIGYAGGIWKPVWITAAE